VAAEALGKLSDTRAAPPLVEALHDPIYDVQIAAAISLGELGHLRAVGPLTKLLNDINPSVRAAVLSALDTLCDTRMETKTDKNVLLRREMRELIALERYKPQRWTASSVQKRREHSRFGTRQAL
jgi:HEAT repeat protein